MALTPQDVSRIAHLARLELSATEEAAMLQQIGNFLGIVDRMSAVDTGGVEPLYTPPTSAARRWWKTGCSSCPR
jgi:aspartyl-tRNA(Asn)/glutamyl-tRNA(Gln) amidotransferase subunit C